MYFLYSLLYTIGFIAFVPRLIFGALRHGKYLPGFTQRMGNIAPLRTCNAVIWLHCVSVGEVQAARPVVRELLKKFPSHDLVISTITVTGQRIAGEIFKTEAKAIFYFPFDWAWTTRRALAAVSPSIVFIMETELWPRFFNECNRRGIPVALVNGRISMGSFRGYKLIRSFMSRVLGNLELAVMQTPEDADRICKLGLRRESVKVAGNVKFDMANRAEENGLTIEFRERFNLKDGRPLIIAASTHATEERTVLEAFALLKRSSVRPKPRLVVAPRHPERFPEIVSLLEGSEFSWTRRSGLRSGADESCDVILLDTIGELRAILPLATLVFVGGSISRNGGHNVLEPAAAGVCTITGPHTENFGFIVQTLVEAGALVQLSEASGLRAAKELAAVFGDLLINDARRETYALRAHEVIDQNSGASERVVEMLTPLFTRKLPEMRNSCKVT